MEAPRLTVALLTPDNFATIAKTVAHVASQSAASDIELLILAAKPEAVTVDESLAAPFGSVRIVAADLARGTGPARAQAVREASAPVLVFCEDHCFPQPGWAEALIKAHKETWAAVGPVVLNANPESLVSWADYLMGYGPWLAPGRTMERDHLPGHNSSYKVAALLPLGRELDDFMEAESTLHWKLRSLGRRLLQESRAKVAHTNFSRWGTWIPVVFHAGRVFADTRAISWSRGRRAAFAAGAPLIPFVRFARHMRQGIEAGIGTGLLVRVAPVLFIGLVADAAGQFAGCISGAGGSRATLVDSDFHRNAPRMRVSA
jgi:hypothetical protein